MNWYGLTGGLGTGKSTVSELLKKQGIPVIDADRLAREVIEKGSEGLEQLVRAFGPGILTNDGELDRKKMADLVFSDTKKLALLEAIIHPLVQIEVRKQKAWLKDQNCAWAVYDVPLLFEKKLQNQFDGIILVTATEQQQFERVRLRNAWTDEEIRKRIVAQTPLSEKIHQSQYVIDNSGSLQQLEKKVAELVGLLNDKSKAQE